MLRCPKCAHESDGEFDRCPVCGYLDEPFECARCGESYQGLDACPACGKARWEIRCEQHPDAVAPGRCVVCSRAVCRDCNRGDGRAFLCAAHEGVVVIQGWAQIYSTMREFEAQLVLENLEVEGFDARMFSQKDKMISVDLGDFSIVRILVPAWEYERAQEVIRGHMDQSGELAFACPNCGEVAEPGATRCTSCGRPLGPIVPA